MFYLISGWQLILTMQQEPYRLYTATSSQNHYTAYIQSQLIKSHKDILENNTENWIYWRENISRMERNNDIMFKLWKYQIDMCKRFYFIFLANSSLLIYMYFIKAICISFIYMRHQIDCNLEVFWMQSDLKQCLWLFWYFEK